jgi:hypothetical protein
MPTVGPIKETRVPAVYDRDNNGFGGTLDMDGPEIGMVAYSEPGGNLHIEIKIQFGQPNTKYEVFLVGGPSHNTGTGFRVIGTLATNGNGSGVGAFSVAHATLLSSPYGPGYRTDHIDLLQNVGDLSKGCLTAGAINYFVCRERDQIPHPGFKLTETLKGEAGKGDPLTGHNTK